jgi:peptide-methionine (R)-S-oxide reductase
MKEDAKRSDAEWKQALSAEQYEVLRRKGTERAFTGRYYNSKEEGVYRCAGCGNPLFDSETKFDSGTGWPSYYQPVSRDAVQIEEDNSYGMIRLEVLCSRCGGHLGHVFPDGPQPTGQRYCIISVSLDFEPRAKLEDS